MERPTKIGGRDLRLVMMLQRLKERGKKPKTTSNILAGTKVFLSKWILDYHWREKRLSFLSGNPTAWWVGL